MALMLGRLPAVPTKPRLRLSQFMLPAEVPAPPAAAEYYSGVPSWPMYGNDFAGDCTWAYVGHAIGSSTADESGPAREALFTDLAILGAYSAMTGYDPATGANDDGCVIQDVLGYWRKNGLRDTDGKVHKLAAFAEVNVSNLTEVKQALFAFGNLDLGHTVYQGDMDAFNAGKDWSAAYSRGQLLGGHSTELVGYDANGGWLVTWGGVQRFTWGWWNARMEEAWLPILTEWAQAGKSPSGYDLWGLGQVMHDLTGDPNPFPAPPPLPPPSGDPDADLWTTAGPWSAVPRSRKDLVPLAGALQTWGAAKGYR